MFIRFFLIFLFTISIFGEIIIPDKIEIYGNEVTKSYVIMQILKLESNKTYDTSKSEVYINNLIKSGLFESASIEFENRGDQNIMMISVKEQFFLLPVPFLRFHNNGTEDLSYVGMLLYRNLLGMNHDVYFLASFGYQKQYKLNYNAKTFRNSDFYFNSSIEFGEYTDKKYFREADDIFHDIFSIEFKPGYHINDYTKINFLMRYNERNFAGPGLKNSFITLGSEFKWDNFDRFNYPTKGYYIESSLNYNFPAGEDNVNFVNTTLDLSKPFKLFDGPNDSPFILSTNVRLNFNHGDEMMPQDKIFLNYDELIRGFNPVITGDSYARLSLALRIKSLDETFSVQLFDKKKNSLRVEMVTELFVDNGFIGKSYTDFEDLNESLVTTVGLSHYVKNPFAANWIRFDFGYSTESMSGYFYDKEKFRFSLALVEFL
ncbi:MAG: BamA/TamA family outer membrane protein [Candidatus Delongbacteria bacterium]|nr:BamA/TamA family outer membrane protein [Candidatus Delongbacteria bacterium]MBN2835808.1 BamA/TamA family outer membrane protein [Candidatus Delongbacteria bacterium]